MVVKSVVFTCQSKVSCRFSAERSGDREAVAYPTPITIEMCHHRIQVVIQYNFVLIYCELSLLGNKWNQTMPAKCPLRHYRAIWSPHVEVANSGLYCYSYCMLVMHESALTSTDSAGTIQPPPTWASCCVWFRDSHLHGHFIPVPVGCITFSYLRIIIVLLFYFEQRELSRWVFSLRIYLNDYRSCFQSF